MKELYLDKVETQGNKLKLILMEINSGGENFILIIKKRDLLREIRASNINLTKLIDKLESL